MNRRGFLSSILALGVAPAIVRADSLMQIIPRSTTIIIPAAAEIAAPASGLFTVGMITKEALRILEQNLILSHEINKKFARFRSAESNQYRALNDIFRD